MEKFEDQWKINNIPDRDTQAHSVNNSQLKENFKIENTSSDKAEEKTPQEPSSSIEKVPHKQEAEKIIKHFQEELKKVEDLPQETEIKKWRKINECLRLLHDWLPFGYLDGFQGIENLMDVLEQAKSKLRISYPVIQENTSRQIALEMAFQYQLWEGKDQEKINIINNFIDKWLKDKSLFYQAGERFKNNALKTPEKYLEQRAKTGYTASEPPKEELLQEPDKISQWFVNQIGESLKLLGQREGTLSLVAKILALQNAPYDNGIDKLALNIENKNLQFNTLSEVRQIEEWKDETKIQYFTNLKAGLGVFPSMPLKVEFYEKLIEEKTKNLQPEEKELLFALLNTFESEIKNKATKEKLEQLKAKISQLTEKEKDKEKENPTPEVVKKAVEVIKKEEQSSQTKDKKKASTAPKIGGLGGWGKLGNIFGFSLIMFLILIFLGEFKLLEKATGWGGGGGKGKK